VEGKVVGVDISVEMLEIARRRCAEEELQNVVFEQGNAQCHTFPAASFDLCISRFGVMFFADPEAAFANIARAMRPGARLVWIVWQSQKRNEWSGAIRRALSPENAISADVAPAFSLGDPAIAMDLLKAAGFMSIDFADVHEPVFYGPDVDTALDALTSFEFVKQALARTSEPPGRVSQRLRDLLEAHRTTEGVLFDSRSWIITAHRAIG
jgi:SAM-dependent methyltransferase